MWLGSSVAVSCGVSLRRSSDLLWLWLWCRLAATSPIQLLAWEPPCTAGVVKKEDEKIEGVPIRA